MAVTANEMSTDVNCSPATSAREHSFDLPVGYLDESGSLHRHIRIRKMTGKEEALLTDRKLRNNPGKLITELLASCTVKLGDVSMSPNIAGQLTSADRNYILLELRKVTFGSAMEARYSCPNCSSTFTASEDLDEFEVRMVDDEQQPEIEVELEDGYTDTHGTVHRRARFRLPTGADEERVSVVMHQNPSRGMNALLTRCLISLGDLEKNQLKGLGQRLFSELTMGDRARIERAMREEMPGVDLRHEVQCDTCGHEYLVALDMTNFFSLQ